MRELVDRRENILRLLKRHKEHLGHLDLAKRTHDEVLLWLIAYSTSLEESKSNLLGLWYGFGSLYQAATIDCPGEALRGVEICAIFGDTSLWSKYVRIRDQLIYYFAVHLRTHAQSSSVDGVYYYTPPNVEKRKQIQEKAVKKMVHPQHKVPLIIPSTFFAWPARC